MLAPCVVGLGDFEAVGSAPSDEVARRRTRFGPQLNLASSATTLM
jgi:hypothetical protein